MAEIGRTQDTLAYELNNSIFIAIELKQQVAAALSADTMNADDVSRWLRWGKLIRDTLPNLSARAIAWVQDQYKLSTVQEVTDTATAISNAWGAVQTRIFNSYPRSANGYLEGYLWTVATDEPVARSVTLSAIPNLAADLQAFVDAFTTA